MKETFTYDMQARILFLMFSKRVFGYLTGILGKEKAALIRRKAKKEYRKMLLRTPSVGGKDNIFRSGLIMAAMFFAVYKAANGTISEQMFGEMTDHAAHTPFLLKSYSQKDAFSEKMMRQKTIAAERSQKREYSTDWVFTHEIKGPDEHITTFRQCAICELGKREDCFALVKYICKIDFITYDQMGANLIRTQTLADGDDVCEFHVVKKTNVRHPPSW